MIDRSRQRYHTPGSRATQLEIQKWVVRQYGFVPESGWIEHCRQLFGITAAAADAAPVNPCPPEYQPAIRQSFAHFGMLPK